MRYYDNQGKLMKTVSGIIRKNIVIVAVVVSIIIIIGLAYFLLQKPSFTISTSPSTLNIARGGTETITINYDPNPPFNMGMNSSVSGPGSGVQFGNWINPPFTFQVVVSENAALGTYTMTLEATDMDTGAKATTTFTVIVT